MTRPPFYSLCSSETQMELEHGLQHSRFVECGLTLGIAVAFVVSKTDQPLFCSWVPAGGGSF